MPDIDIRIAPETILAIAVASLMFAPIEGNVTEIAMDLGKAIAIGEHAMKMERIRLATPRKESA